jgi:hypothetical protein
MNISWCELSMTRASVAGEDGQRSSGPGEVPDQSLSRMSAPIVPPPAKREAIDLMDASVGPGSGRPCPRRALAASDAPSGDIPLAGSIALALAYRPHRSEAARGLTDGGMMRAEMLGYMRSWQTPSARTIRQDPSTWGHRRRGRIARASGATGANSRLLAFRSHRLERGLTGVAARTLDCASYRAHQLALPVGLLEELAIIGHLVAAEASAAGCQHQADLRPPLSHPCS